MLVEQIKILWNQIETAVSGMRSHLIPDILDILLVAFIVYSVFKLIRETRSIQLAKGLGLLGLVYLIVTALRMQASAFILQRVFSDVILVLIILFQPEIRHVLESAGRSSLSRINFFGGRDERGNEVRGAAIAVSKACSAMSAKQIGALIVFERETLLGDVAKTGTVVEALVTQELIGNIFFPNSPLHDGAVIIRNGRIYAAGCVLPLTKNQDLTSDLGMRHRAALGMSEESDAMIVVTSEETGGISVALKGELQRGLSEATLREALIDHLTQGAEDGSAYENLLKKLLRRGQKK